MNRTLELRSVFSVDLDVFSRKITCVDRRAAATTGADVHFFAIGDHRAALREDVETLTTTPFLGPLQAVAGFLYDVGSGELQEVVRWQRPPAA